MYELQLSNLYTESELLNGIDIPSRCGPNLKYRKDVNPKETGPICGVTVVLNTKLAYSLNTTAHGNIFLYHNHHLESLGDVALESKWLLKPNDTVYGFHTINGWFLDRLQASQIAFAFEQSTVKPPKDISSYDVRHWVEAPKEFDYTWRLE